VLPQQRPREVELGLHDGQPVLLEHERGSLPLAERLTFPDEAPESFSHGIAEQAGGLAQFHMPKSGQTRFCRPLPEGTDPGGVRP
jgi:hypothetical protein